MLRVTSPTIAKSALTVGFFSSLLVGQGAQNVHGTDQHMGRDMVAWTPSLLLLGWFLLWPSSLLLVST
jgi:hypothetical protein